MFIFIYYLLAFKNVDRFSNVIGMTRFETDRLIVTLKSFEKGELKKLPKYLVESSSEGLAFLINELIKTGFLDKE